MLPCISKWQLLLLRQNYHCLRSRKFSVLYLHIKETLTDGIELSERFKIQKMYFIVSLSVSDKFQFCLLWTDKVSARNWRLEEIVTVGFPDFLSQALKYCASCRKQWCRSIAKRANHSEMVSLLFCQCLGSILVSYYGADTELHVSYCLLEWRRQQSTTAGQLPVKTIIRAVQKNEDTKLHLQ